MSLFQKRKPFKVYANYKMMDSSVFDKNLSFENTPLQNLKNILSEADASMELEANKSPGPHKSQHSVLFEKKGISKSTLQAVVDNLFSTPGQYVSAASVGEIMCALCFEERGKTSVEMFNTNIYINIIRELKKIK